MYAQMAAAGISALGQAAQDAPMVSGLSGRTPINVQPVGVNLGSMLQPFNEGSATNGGSPSDMSTYVPVSQRQPMRASNTFRASEKEPFIESIDLYIIGGFVVAGAIAFRLFKRN